MSYIKHLKMNDEQNIHFSLYNYKTTLNLLAGRAASSLALSKPYSSLQLAWCF